MTRKNELPFGGLQLGQKSGLLGQHDHSLIIPTVMSGDFFQLPPIPEIDEGNKTIPAQFAFLSEAWTTCIGPRVYVLTK